jgi:predicted dehydrogenase
MDKIRFALLGAGSRASVLAKTIMDDPKKQGDLIALCDINEKALLREEKAVNDLLKHTTKNYTNYLDALENPDVDCAIIATPDQFHHPMALDAFRLKKHVFLEKPVGINLPQMLDIVTAAKKSGKILEIGYVLRYSPFFCELKKMIETDELGRILFANALEEFYGGGFVFGRGWFRKRANTSGVMGQKISHDLDLAYWLFGKPRKIMAFENSMEFRPGNWDSQAAHCSECNNHCPYYSPPSPFKQDQCVYNTDKTGADVADNAQVTVQFETGLNFSLGMNFFPARAQDDRHWRIVGSKGEVTGRLSQQKLRFDPRHDETGTKSVVYETAPPHGMGHGGGDQIQLLEFMTALNQKKEAKAGIESAYWSSISVMGAQISADSGLPVNVKDLISQYPFPYN